MGIKRFIEITSKSPEEAKEVAVRELKPGESLVASELLAAPARGIFGSVGNEVKIRFTIEAAPPPPEEDFSEEPAEEEVKETPPDGGVDVPPPSEEISVQPPKTPVAKEPMEDLAKSPKMEMVYELITEVAKGVGVGELKLQNRQENDVWLIEVSGDNVSQLIGKHGRTLDSLQFLLNIILNKSRDGKAKLMLDVLGYREKRHRGLIQLANRMYRKALDTGHQVELEPMSTIDRRTIHLALKDRSGIETFSKGIEPLRRVVISPKKPAGNRAPREPRTSSRPTSTPQEDSPASGRPKPVPMFIEEDSSNED